jgi:hypothetical protein
MVLKRPNLIKRKADLEYISKKTKLSTDRASVLTEEPQDFHLLIDQLSLKRHYIKDLKKVSFSLLFKLKLFKNAQDFNFKIEEKAYVADTVCKYFNPRNKSKKKELSLTTDSTEKSALIAFCLISLFFSDFQKEMGDYVPHGFRNWEDYIVKGLSRGKSLNIELSKHVREWMEVIQKTKKEIDRYEY